MAIRNTGRALVIMGAVAALMALAGCPGAVKKTETYLGNEGSAVNHPVAEGMKDAAQNGALEVLGPGGEIVTAGTTVMGAGVAAAQIAVQKAADDALAESMLHPGDAKLEAKADYLDAKAECFNRHNCAKWNAIKAAEAKANGGGNHSSGD